jgi:hypothetical protein
MRQLCILLVSIPVLGCGYSDDDDDDDDVQTTLYTYLRVYYGGDIILETEFDMQDSDDSADVWWSVHDGLRRGGGTRYR